MVQDLYKNYFIEEVGWKSVLTEIEQVNSALANVLLTHDFPEHLTLIKAQYTYGSFIVKNGEMNLCLKTGETKAISELEDEIKKKLDYSFIPHFMVMNKMSEVFIDVTGRTIPLNCIYPGEYAGLFEYFDYITDLKILPPWHVTAGARNIFLIPKISEQRSISRLRKQYSIPEASDFNDNFEHWNIFKHIANDVPINQRWKMTILIFTKEWFDKKQEFTYQNAIHQIILKNAWEKIRYNLYNVESSITWQNFIEAVTLRRLFPKPYIADTIKHLISILFGRIPALCIVDQSIDVAPIEIIQHAFLEVYEMKDYFPLIASSTKKYPTQNESYSNYTDVYYSLNHPTLLDGSPSSKKDSRIINHLKEIKLLIDTTQRKINDPLLSQFEFYYFHSYDMNEPGILHPAELPKFDSRISNQISSIKDRKFCVTSSFWNGCILIRLKN